MDGPLGTPVLNATGNRPVIVYDLICEHEHRFEGWFDNHQDYQDQCRGGLLACPVCASARVRRLPHAGHLRRHGDGAAGAGAEAGARPPAVSGGEAEMVQLVRRLHDYVERHYVDVGRRFAEEARRIHYGEAEERNIRGQASAEEVAALEQEGIQTLPLPPKPPPKERLN